MEKSKSKPALGIIFHPRFSPDKLVGYARKAEAAGFDELWLWDDCFLPGAFTAAAIALSATDYLKVGIGLLPAVAYNPLFMAMEITTLACAFPGRLIPGFGHGVRHWMEQIGTAPKSSLKALEENVSAVRCLLKGERITLNGEYVRLDEVQMQTVPDVLPPLYIGGMRSKTLQMAGRIGNGTILTAMSSPAYVEWARAQIDKGMIGVGREDHRIVVYMDVKVSNDGEAARMAARRTMAGRLPWVDVQTDVLGITGEVASLFEKYGKEDAALHIPDAWVDSLCAAGTPEQVVKSVRRLAESGADAVIFQPLDGDIDCLDEYARYLIPLFN